MASWDCTAPFNWLTKENSIVGFDDFDWFDALDKKKRDNGYGKGEADGDEAVYGILVHRIADDCRHLIHAGGESDDGFCERGVAERDKAEPEQEGQKYADEHNDHKFDGKDGEELCALHSHRLHNADFILVCRDGFERIRHDKHTQYRDEDYAQNQEQVVERGDDIGDLGRRVHALGIER